MIINFIDYINEEIHQMNPYNINLYNYLYISSTYVISGKYSLLSKIYNYIEIFNKCQYMDIHICMDMDTIDIDKNYLHNIINIDEIDIFLINQSIEENYY